MINYILLAVFVLFVVVYKLWHRTRFVKLADMDIWTGRRQLEPCVEVKTSKSWWTRIEEIVIG